MSLSTYAPALRKTDPVESIVIDARSRWPQAPREALTAHLAALRTVFANCPASSRRGEWGRRHERHMNNIAEAITRLPAQPAEV